ncbi:hypothetical protein GCM10023206_07810 [Acinetobacter puyangensis]|uniref:Uncharacterized protein n=1 Tax=Acinetobacter puyangensis TaxID=1096779 RepID=A0A240E7F6_9GAMM|nr:hypothetical protein [Acinetobacter puyangensis]SNX44139.1 hypothetical protein SAMN05421731_102298 [Acinetobacter puyangensis]
MTTENKGFKAFANQTSHLNNTSKADEHSEVKPVEVPGKPAVSDQSDKAVQPNHNTAKPQ